MSDDQVKIISIRETNDIQPDSGKMLQRIRVDWKVGDDGPFVNYFPVDDFNEVTARATIDTRARAIVQLRG